MDFISAFFTEYGFSFLMMVIIGFVIALMLEITVKKALAWLEEKVGDKGKTYLAVARTIIIQAFTWIAVIGCTKLLIGSMSLPGGAVFYPVWVGMVYVFQYIFSCWGIKGFIEWVKRRQERSEQRKDLKAQAEATKAELKPVAGTKGLFVDANGRYCDAKGNPV